MVYKSNDNKSLLLTLERKLRDRDLSRNRSVTVDGIDERRIGCLHDGKSNFQTVS